MSKAVQFAVFLALAVAVAALGKTSGGRSWSGSVFSQQQSPLPQGPTRLSSPAKSQPAPPQSASAAPGQTSPRTIETIVLDPAHGGTDEGAHGATGIVEKDVTLALAQVVAAQLRQDGLRVVMTRTGDQTVSFEDRAATANAQPGAVFLSLHVGSSGPVGSACAYYYDFSQIARSASQAAPTGLLIWDLAQQPWQPYSRRLAQLLQAELSARFRGSPDLPSGAAIYQLREINEPAVAVEVENVNAPNAGVIKALAAPLAISVSRAIQSFRAVYGAELR